MNSTIYGMQFYLHHYIWYIFSSATIPIINFLGRDSPKNERSFVVYNIRTRVHEHMFEIWLEKSNFDAVPYNYVAIARSLDTAASKELQNSCVLRREKAAPGANFLAAALCAASAAQKLRKATGTAKELHFRLFLWACGQNLTKNFKFF